MEEGDVDDSVTEEQKTPVLKFGQKSEKHTKSIFSSQGRSNPFKVSCDAH